ncbi:hypothetical protein GJAV_G00236230 [Gymnothorax javanicus]|nr:hypothetical protein GJAV_G00236230 [Gymnothorax javanicus]
MPDPVKSAPKKGSKKAVTKSAGKGGKKRKRSRKESYAIYVYKVLKQVHPDTGRSRPPCVFCFPENWPNTRCPRAQRPSPSTPAQSKLQPSTILPKGSFKSRPIICKEQ